MLHQDKIAQCLKEIQELEKFFREAQDKEILPISFFSSSIELVNRLRTGVYELEALQLHLMQEHLKIWDRETDLKEPAKSIKSEVEVPEIVEPEPIEEKPTSTTNILADTIGRKINSDFGKSLSLNDRFMFQRDLFQGNAKEMNQAFAQLNTSQSLNEALKFLDEKYAIPWNSEPGIALKELLDKRFA